MRTSALVLAFLAAPAIQAQLHPCDPPLEGLGEEIRLSCRSAVSVDFDDLSADEASQECLHVVRRFNDRNADVRLAILEAMVEGEVHVERCREAAYAFERLLLRDPDPFLIYTALKYPSSLPVPVHPWVFVDLLQHPSKDVRREAAMHLWDRPLDPMSVDRLIDLLALETEAKVKVAIAQMLPPEHASVAQEVLLSIVRGRGPESKSALDALADTSDGGGPLLPVLDMDGELRGSAIKLLGTKVDDPLARAALRIATQAGPADQRLLAAQGLLRDDTATETEAWRALALDERLPVTARAALVLEAGEGRAWRKVACAATLQSHTLAEEVNALLEHPDLLRDARERIDAISSSSLDEKWIRPEPSRASIRCAWRPFGAPRENEERIPVGTSFTPWHSFTQDGVTWRAEPFGGGCWVRDDDLTSDHPPVQGTDVLEADVPLAALDHAPLAIAAGEIELFDPDDGFTGIRLRGAGALYQALWKSGREGVLRVLTSLEAELRTGRSPAPR